MRTFGLVFPDEICFVVINNSTRTIWASIQVNNFFDRPRFYGTIFTILIAAVGLCGVLAQMGYQVHSKAAGTGLACWLMQAATWRAFSARVSRARRRCSRGPALGSGETIRDQSVSSLS